MESVKIDPDPLYLQIFEVGTRSILRQLTGHVRPVHVTRFDEDSVHVISGSDDKTLRSWDLPTGFCLVCEVADF